MLNMMGIFNHGFFLDPTRHTLKEVGLLRMDAGRGQKRKKRKKKKKRQSIKNTMNQKKEKERKRNNEQ
jgi:hypothetical protein